jgi:ribosomal protein L40E
MIYCVYSATINVRSYFRKLGWNIVMSREREEWHHEWCESTYLNYTLKCRRCANSNLRVIKLNKIFVNFSVPLLIRNFNIRKSAVNIMTPFIICSKHVYPSSLDVVVWLQQVLFRTRLIFICMKIHLKERAKKTAQNYRKCYIHVIGFDLRLSIFWPYTH